MTREELNRRRDDIEQAVAEGRSFAWLAAGWGVTANAAYVWTREHSTDAELIALGCAPPPPKPRLVPSPLAQRDLAAWRSLGGIQQ